VLLNQDLLWLLVELAAGQVVNLSTEHQGDAGLVGEGGFFKGWLLHRGSTTEFNIGSCSRSFFLLQACVCLSVSFRPHPFLTVQHFIMRCTLPAIIYIFLAFKIFFSFTVLHVMGLRYIPHGNETGLSCLKWNVYLGGSYLPEAVTVSEINVQILLHFQTHLSKKKSFVTHHLHTATYIPTHTD
jgi:hypothetical protein